MDNRRLRIVTIDLPRVDFATIGAFTAQLEAGLGAGTGPVVIDLERVASVGSLGLRALIRAAEGTGAFFGVVAPQPEMRELLTIGCVDEVVTIYASLDAAASAAAASAA
jgi:anti-anti-sigma factor